VTLTLTHFLVVSAALFACGLLAALNELAANISELFKVSCKFQCRQPVLIRQNAVATHLYRIAQEAVSNALKHGKAKKILIALADDGDHVELKVHDNGRGFRKPRGGDGGPSLLRSGVVLADQNGELIGPVLEQGRAPMPKFGFKPDQVADLAVFLHSFRVAGYDVSRQKPATIVVGNAVSGAAYFNEACASCHSITGDLRGIASRIADERVLQQSWLMPGSMAGRGAPVPDKARPPSVTVTEPGKAPVTGALGRIDDFVVSLTTPQGEYRSFRITPRTKVDVADPLLPHRDLLRKYTDEDIHNMTAFLATLK